ncbi:hypothetical protein [Geomesophilobacter sediminis]|uniref:Uncharacterized protein n=1 Tax=Geomesophilobacter sediminis TaxID=2798584 RepID=A0A8J7LYM0_9BACT|nr:hypothetical protein [Geomesophilobacter sediminis]MBJ6725077.1 hypothetical protein [Geomesophilobacter sediminis]
MPTPVKVKNSRRRTFAALLAVLYLCIFLAPLVPVGLPGGTPLVSECSGDCDICGCSPEMRASGSCCCAKKRHALETQQIQDQDLDDKPDCCKKKKSSQTVISCACPLGGGKSKLLVSSEGSELLPFYFPGNFGTRQGVTDFTDHPHRMTSRYGEPPDPPPDLA